LSLERLAALRPEVVATGHGKPMHGQAMRDQLDELAENFDVLAVPASGRYVLEPAVTNKFGAAAWPESHDGLPVYAKVAACAALAFGAAVLFFQISGREAGKD
jgi:hypothetical protein